MRLPLFFNWRRLAQPRILLIIWLGIGAIWLAIILVASFFAAGLRPNAARSETAPVEAPVVLNHLLRGSLNDFRPSFPPRGAPQTEFDGPAGRYRLGDFIGKPVLVNLWATWCAPCLEELPSLDTLQGYYDKDRFEVLAIAADPRLGDQGPAFFARLGIAHLALYRDESLKLSFAFGGANMLPVSILYDSAGREIGRLTGKADWASREARALIDAIIAGRVIY